MVFQYQVWGSNGVMLRVWREASQEHKALWVITEDQGEEWREGRIILPSYDMEYRVRCSGKVCWTRQRSPASLLQCFRAKAHSSLGNVAVFIVFLKLP